MSLKRGPSEKVLECNESENMDSNMCKTLSICTYFEESVPGPSTTLIQILPFKVNLGRRLR